MNLPRRLKEQPWPSGEASSSSGMPSVMASAMLLTKSLVVNQCAPSTRQKRKRAGIIGSEILGSAFSIDETRLSVLCLRPKHDCRSESSLLKPRRQETMRDVQGPVVRRAFSHGTRSRWAQHGSSLCRDELAGQPAVWKCCCSMVTAQKRCGAAPLLSVSRTGQTPATVHASRGLNLIQSYWTLKGVGREPEERSESWRMDPFHQKHPGMEQELDNHTVLLSISQA